MPEIKLSWNDFKKFITDFKLDKRIRYIDNSLENKWVVWVEEKGMVIYTELHKNVNDDDFLNNYKNNIIIDYNNEGLPIVSPTFHSIGADLLETGFTFDVLNPGTVNYFYWRPDTGEEFAGQFSGGWYDAPSECYRKDRATFEIVLANSTPPDPLTDYLVGTFVRKLPIVPNKSKEIKSDQPTFIDFVNYPNLYVRITYDSKGTTVINDFTVHLRFFV